MHNDNLIPVPEKLSRVGLWLTRDNGLLLFLVLLQQFGRRSVGLTSAENLAAM